MVAVDTPVNCLVVSVAVKMELAEAMNSEDFDRAWQHVFQGRYDCQVIDGSNIPVFDGGELTACWQ